MAKQKEGTRYMYCVVCFMVTPDYTSYKGSDPLFWFPSPCLFETLEEANCNRKVLMRNESVVASIRKMEVGAYTMKMIKEFSS